MLFNRKFEVGRLNFQGSFDFLCNQLPHTYNLEMFLYNNTIFPLCIPFTDKDKQDKAINYFKGDYPDKIQKCLNVSEITQNRTYIRICKECAKEDLKNYGEAFYRRQHEIELNRMCAKHRTPLYEYVIFPYKLPSRYNDFYTVLNNAKEIEVPEKFKLSFLDITDDISYLFEADLTGWDIQITRDKIYHKMIHKGYVSVNGLTYQKNFSKDFKEYYTEEFLDYIGSNFDIDENDSWLRHTTTRKKLIANPLKYLLVIRYLFGSFENFYMCEDKHNFFKTAPYPCLNKVCPNYNKLVINNYTISISHSYPLATFKCEHCGFIYSRRGPDKENNDIYKKTYVKDYGRIWSNKLKEYSKQGFSIRKISRLLGCSFDTIKRHIKKIESDKTINADSINNAEMENEIAVSQDTTLLIEKYKSMFLEMLSTNPEMGAKLIFRKHPNAYKLVSKYDRDWIENNLLKKKYTQSSKNKRLEKYWMDKDEFLLKKLIKSLGEIKSGQELYSRITIALLQKYIGYYNLHQNKSNLPKCFKIISLERETISNYQKRRVDYVIKQLTANNKKITLAKVIYDAGLKNRASQEVLNYIEEKIKEYNSGKIIK